MGHRELGGTLTVGLVLFPEGRQSRWATEKTLLVHHYRGLVWEATDGSLCMARAEGKALSAEGSWR
jgi:hypothetical protein